VVNKRPKKARAGGGRGRRAARFHDPAEETLARLRANGRRLTRQRTLIWRTLLERRGSHLSASEIAKMVRVYNSELHQATVYRTLEALVQEGLLLQTDLGAQHSYYELPAEHRHHHVVCSSCGAVTHIHDAEIQPLLTVVQAASGFTLKAAELTFYGRCATCPSS
jgi:Fur family ferric uptake transcriptional regulator